jgi:hypothetical protein
MRKTSRAGGLYAAYRQRPEAAGANLAEEAAALGMAESRTLAQHADELVNWSMKFSWQSAGKRCWKTSQGCSRFRS